MNFIFQKNICLIFVRWKSYKNTLNTQNFILPIKHAIIKNASINNLSIINKPSIKSQLKYIIHDGPPYANGLPHVGHALNKILKDIIARYKTLRGYDVSFKPGWDCHGLPIEMKSATAEASTITELRINASNIATKYINIQKKEFQSWGVTADWDCHYSTFDNKYQSKELEAFSILCHKKLVFRDLLPTFWSCSSRTALAEAELEYNDRHTSDTVFLKLHLDSKNSLFPDYNDISLLVWTTTPWTLVANEAVGVKGDFKYVLCSVDNSSEKIITGVFSLEKLRLITKKKIEILSEISGKQLQHLHYRHPIFHDKICSVLEASFVTDDKGTGLVHIAPAHGKEDFELMKIYGKFDTVLVDNDGNFTDKCGESLRGLSVFNSGIDRIISILGQDIFHQEKLIHSYPYDWRTNQPVIIKLSTQWFIDINKLSQNALKAYENVEVLPTTMKEAMYQFIKNRPNWCISRQRKWGVPIPILYNLKNEPIFDEDFFKHISQRVEREGSNFWWEETVENIVPKEFFVKWGLTPSTITKSEDIFDIWFDSGLSWWCALPNESVADLYLEGTDQFRGWFSSSLLMGVALKGISPYKSIVTHGFTVDGEGKKMSKSLGNVIDPSDVVEKYGVDVLRYWACASGCSRRNNISDAILNRIESQYSLLRNMFRFILGNTSTVSLSQLGELNDPSLFHSLLPQDRYILHIVANDFIKPIVYCYDNYQFAAITPLLEELISKVSKSYFTIIKDRLYCDSVSSQSYISCVTTLVLLLRSLVPIAMPILPCLIKEIQEAFLTSNLSSHESFFIWPDFVNSWTDRDLVDIFERIILPLRNSLLSIDWSHHGIIIRNQSNPMNELKIEIFVRDSLEIKAIEGFNNGSSEWQSNSPLCEILRCSFVKVGNVLDTDLEETMITAGEGRWLFRISQQLKDNKCERCRRFTNVIENSEECCSRCMEVVSNKQDNEKKNVQL